MNLVILAEEGEEFERQLQLCNPLRQDDQGTKGRETETTEERLPEEEQQQLQYLLGRYQHIFGKNPSRTDKISFTIETGDSKLVQVRPYRVPVRWKAHLEREIKTLLDLKIIRESNSFWLQI